MNKLRNSSSRERSARNFPHPSATVARFPATDCAALLNQSSITTFPPPPRMALTWSNSWKTRWSSARCNRIRSRLCPFRANFPTWSNFATPLAKVCPDSAGIYSNLVDFIPEVAEVGRISSNIGADVGPKLVGPGSTLAKCCKFRNKFGGDFGSQTWLTSVDVLPYVTQIRALNPISTNFRPDSNLRI